MPTATIVETGTSYATLAAALAAVSGGQSIELASGTFAEGDLATTTPCQIRPRADAVVVIDSSTFTNGLRLGDDTTVEGPNLTLRGSADAAIRGNGTNRSIDVLDVVFEACGVGLGFILTGSRLERLTFRALTGTPLQVTTAGNPDLSVALLDRCAAGIHAVSSKLSHVTAVGLTGGAYALHGRELHNCVAVRNASTAAGMRWVDAISGCLSVGHASASAGNFYADPGVGGLEVEPLFAGEAAYNYRPGEGSPLIGGGGASDALLDVERLAFGDPPAIGCYRYRSSAAVPRFPSPAELAVDGGLGVLATFERLPAGRQETLRMATWLALFTDRRADAGERSAPFDEDPRGWWGDAVHGRRFGSRLWQLRDEPVTSATAAKVQAAAAEALEVLREDGLVARTEVVAEVAEGDLDRVNLLVRHHRTSGGSELLEFGDLWEVFGGR